MPPSLSLPSASPIEVSTPLGPKAFILEGFEGTEAVSQPFRFELSLLAKKNLSVPFEKMLGQKVSVTLLLPDGKNKRHFSGIISRLTQGREFRAQTGDIVLVRYRLEMVPPFWLLKHRAQSRIFQQLTVEEILKKVLQGLDVVYELRTRFEPRDYCVQYRESDFDFASRLMEEEGISYYFRHTAEGSKMVLSLMAQCHDVPAPSSVVFEEAAGGVRKEDGVYTWEKSQDIRPGRYTLRDHCFEMPEKTLEVQGTPVETVQVGKAVHHQQLTVNEKLEVYDYPGGYAQRFDGVAPGGGDRAADLQKITRDGERTVDLRVEQGTIPGLVVFGKSRCRQFTPGHKFTIADQHRTSSMEGSYLLLSVKHEAKLAGSFQETEAPSLTYHNEFHCIPGSVAYRPPRRTPKARVEGTQTAVVVGPAGEEIFTDKYGRVKVQFPWDRHGKHDAGSSCWVRVATVWAGQQWGAVHIPRVGQEVVVAFLEGDPDQPIIVGSVYNAKQMPPYALPANRTQSGIKSRSSLAGGAEDFNELRFEDKKDAEDICFHAQKDFHRVVENDDDLKVGHDQKIEIKNNRTETVQEGNEKVTVSKGNRDVEITLGHETLTIKKGNQTTKINLGKSETQALQSIVLKVGKSSVTVDQQGVKIKGLMIQLEGQIKLDIDAPLTSVSGKGMLTLRGGLTQIN